MTKSTHRVEVVRLPAVEPHPNADSLGIVRVCGYQCVVRLGDWHEGDVAAYVQPDSVVPLSGPFAFLDRDGTGGTYRVRVVRLRGEVSQGVLVPAPPGLAPGDDAATVLGVTRYVPPETSDEDGPSPPGSGLIPVYDVESARRYAAELFRPGEMLVVHEKIHGENGRWTWQDGRLYAGSRTRWKSDDSAWAQAIRRYPEIVDWLKDHEGWTLYGELYGAVGGFPYDQRNRQRGIRFFDVLDARGRFLPLADASLVVCGPIAHQWAPLLGAIPYTTVDALLPYAEGRSTLGDHVREGCVVRPSDRDGHPRPVLKLVGDGFLMRQ